MKKRIFAAMAATLVAATALAACGGSNDSASTGSDSGKTSPPASTADSGKTDGGLQVMRLLMMLPHRQLRTEPKPRRLLFPG